MKWSKKNKKKIIIFLLVIIMLLVGSYFLKEFIKKQKFLLEEMGKEKYEEIHNLYYYGETIEYEVDEEKRRIYIEEGNKKYYKITNYEEILNKASNSYKGKLVKALDIKEKEENYYVVGIGRGLSGYYGTRLEIKKYSKNKIEYKAYSKFCYKESRVNYGERCKEEGYYEIEKPFILVKEEGTWKVEEYTSVFEFNESEIK